VHIVILGLFLFFYTLADAEHVAVGMPHVHLAGVPRHIRRRPCDLDALLDAALVHFVDVVDPGPNVFGNPVRPRPPCPPSHKKISESSQHTPPNVGGVPQSHAFFQPSFSNHSKLCFKSETFRIGVK
jgi:hypothetical protein